MSFTRVINNDTVTKKCGEIVITMKNNAKNVYSFNCWFCDTICIQMKKFTLHLEKEHVGQLEVTASIDHNNVNNDICTEKESTDILDEDVKKEDCNHVIKTEREEQQSVVPTCLNSKDELLPKFQDPLETIYGNNEEISLNYENISTIDEKKSEQLENIQSSEDVDVEMHNFTDSDHNDYNSDFSGEDHSTFSDMDDNSNEKPLRLIKDKNKAKEKEFILALIQAYHENPQLWNTSLAEKCNLKQKEHILQKITEDINTKLKMKLKLYMVKKKLNYICKQYEREVEKELNGSNENNGTENSKIWFYENMSFLKTITECKLKMKRKKPNHKVKPLSDNLLCDLIDIYKNYNSLWDVNHLAYTVKDKRHETMQSMLEDIENKMNMTLDIYKLEKHLSYIHKSFAKDKQYRLECQANQKEFQPSCSFFDKCDFLEMHQGPFKCANCSEIIDSYNDFQIHKSGHDSSIPFKCQECGMGFKKITNYTIHAKRHLRVFKFHCKICGKGYPFNAELDLHMRSHTGAQPYLCSVCGEGFRTAISYDNHIRRHEERFKYFCHICKKGFNHMTRLNDHIKAHLNVRDVICTVCGKGFTSRKYLNHHKRIHEGKNYSCTICGKSFAQDAGLRAHKKYHGTPIGVSSMQKEQNKYKI
ncbi:uncharacterized protein ACRADG_008850 isoform 1-T2 [Cochliomyia hominivorax]